MDRLQRNVDAWNRMYPKTSITVDFCQQTTERAGFHIAHAKDGSLIDVMQTDRAELFLQSKYRPLEEAKRYVKQFEGLKQGSCILFLGMGNGYILRELLQYEQATFVFYEPSVEYFCHVLCEYDVADLIASSNMKLYIKGLNAERLSLDMYGYVHALNWHLFYLDYLPKYQQLYGEELPYLERLYEQSRIHGYQNYDNRNTFSKSHMENAIYNLRYIYRGESVYEYRDVLKDIPVIMVAAGPSLEKNVDLLKQYRNQAFVLCVDHAVPMLAKKGIVPHAYMTVDARKDSAMFQHAGAAPWFVYTTSNPEAIRTLENPRLIFASTIYGYAERLFQLTGSDLFQMASGGSVATNAVQVAMYMGSKTIILIGQDLALTGNKLYAGIDEMQDLLEGHDAMYIKAFDGGEVLSRADYKAYIDYYEALAAQRKDINFVNATEGGAYIEGMQHMTLKEAMDRYGVQDGFDGDSIFNEKPPLMTFDKQLLLRKEYYELMRYFVNLKREAKTAIAWVERGLHILQESDYQNPELAKVEQKISAFQGLYNSHPGKSILDMGVGKEIQDALLDINFTKENLTEELMRLYRKMLVFFQGVEDCVVNAIPILQDVLDDVNAAGD